MRKALSAALMVIGCVVVAACYPPPPLGRPTPEPLVPTSLVPTPTLSRQLLVTVTATATAAPSPVAGITPTALATPQPAPLPTATVPVMTAVTITATETTMGQDPAVSAPMTWTASASQRSRVGVGVPIGPVSSYDWGRGLPGWYVNWHVQMKPERPGGLHFAQMVRLYGSEYRPDLATIQAVARANPGALWLIGNEPDVPWQDNATPEQYAASYGVLYRAIKQTDPTAQVAIGGVSQPTSLRIAYLDRILEAYQARYGKAMPVDVWNVHAFILREERNAWGVGIPPGMSVDRGQLYEIEDHDDLAIFQRQIVDFRRWMAERGLRDKPLIVSEYGILMPEDYGFAPQQVAAFMTATFDYFLNARDSAIGFPADDHRLVQAFCWYSAADTLYATSNLFDPQTRALTPLGKVFLEYVARLR